MILSSQGQGLLSHLQQLFVGHHARTEDIAPVSEKTERYDIEAHVIWQFDHEVTTRSVAGNAAIQGSHFGNDEAAFNQHLKSLCERAIQDRDIRGPFMQFIDTAGAEGLTHASQHQPVHDFGSYSRLRHCGTCSGSGDVSCGGCGGKGRRTCSGCGGGGRVSRVVTQTRWNGRQNETYNQTVYQSCPSCGGGGRTVCTSCGGSGSQQCGACSGHGYFTDIAKVQGIAKPRWIVPALTGLAADALTQALKRGGPERARQLVELQLDSTGYNGSDNWVTSYRGHADVVELDLTVVKRPYTVAAAGSQTVPITTPPIFDQLLADELSRIAALRQGKRGDARVKRQARKLFAAFCELPMVARGMSEIAKRDKKSKVDPGPIMQRSAQGFMTAESAALIGSALMHILNRVSPTHSAWSWRLITAVPALAGFGVTATKFTWIAPQSIWSAILPLGGSLIQAALSMVIVAPVAWLVSLIVSAVMRRKVPAEYRQRGRNWLPFKRALKICLAAVVVGAVYGTAASRGWIPTLGRMLAPAISYAQQWLPADSPMQRFLGGQRLAPASAVPASTTQQIKDIQHKLITGGYLRGRADGVSGPRTRAAIRQYVRNHHLKEDLSMADLWRYMARH